MGNISRRNFSANMASYSIGLLSAQSFFSTIKASPRPSDWEFWTLETFLKYRDQKFLISKDEVRIGEAILSEVIQISRDANLPDRFRAPFTLNWKLNFFESCPENQIFCLNHKDLGCFELYIDIRQSNMHCLLGESCCN